MRSACYEAATTSFFIIRFFSIFFFLIKHDMHQFRPGHGLNMHALPFHRCQTIHFLPHISLSVHCISAPSHTWYAASPHALCNVSAAGKKLDEYIFYFLFSFFMEIDTVRNLSLLLFSVTFHVAALLLLANISGEKTKLWHNTATKISWSNSWCSSQEQFEAWIHSDVFNNFFLAKTSAAVQYLCLVSTSIACT